MQVTAASLERIFREARAHAAAGRKDAAEALYRAVIARFPANRRAADALAELSASRTPPLTRETVEALLSLYRAGRLEEAERQAATLAAGHPRAGVLRKLLGAIAAARGEPEQAERRYREALALAPEDAEVLNNLGDVLNTLGRHEEAVDVLGKALAARPDSFQAHNNLGLACHYLGRRDLAIAHLARAVALDPDYGEGYRNLTTAMRIAAGDPLVETMEAAHARSRGENRMQLAFALGKAYDDLGETERAFGAFAEGNRLRKAQLGYRPAHDRTLFATIEAMFAGPPAALRQAPEMGPRPIFVVGMPRSGTSLVEQILASHSHVHGAGELDLLRRSVLPSMEKALAEGAFAPGAADLSAIADTYRAGLARLSTDAAVVVDKLPGNAKWLGFALSAMPEAKAVWVTREPMATAWSIFRTYFPAKGLGYTSDLADILAYQRLQDRLAERWAALFPGRFLCFSYEALTEAQEKETRRLLAFCGLGWEDACLLFHENARAVRTASALQVRQPLYRGSSRDWLRYEPFLRPLLVPDAS